MKKGWDTLALWIWIIVFILWLGAFIFTEIYGNGIVLVEPPRANVSQEFIYQETKECNKMKDTIKENLLDECSNEYDWASENTIEYIQCRRKDIEEIFYSPVKNECLATYHYASMYFIRWITTNKFDRYEAVQDSNLCFIYKNWEEIKKAELAEWVKYWEDPCYPRIQEVWLDEIAELKK